MEGHRAFKNGIKLIVYIRNADKNDQIKYLKKHTIAGILLLLKRAFLHQP